MRPPNVSAATKSPGCAGCLSVDAKDFKDAGAGDLTLYCRRISADQSHRHRVITECHGRDKVLDANDRAG